MMGSMGYGQPAPGLFSGGGALPSQTSTEQPRLGPKESTFDFVGVSRFSRLRYKLLAAAEPILPLDVAQLAHDAASAYGKFSV